jgi:hypothetical protein
MLGKGAFLRPPPFEGKERLWKDKLRRDFDLFYAGPDLDVRREQDL